MPRLIDREANATLVHPLVMRLLADEGPGAVTYRRVASESGLSLAAVRNMWQTQEKLLQRGAVHARLLLPTYLFLPVETADPAAALQEGIRRLLPLGAGQPQAWRALQALRQHAAASPAREVLANYERAVTMRVIDLVGDVRWLGQPPPRPPRVHSAQEMATRTEADLDAGSALVRAVVTGLAHQVSHLDEACTTDRIQACLHQMVPGLLD